jgi:hypothetical protein
MCRLNTILLTEFGQAIVGCGMALAAGNDMLVRRAMRLYVTLCPGISPYGAKQSTKGHESRRASKYSLPTL